MGFSTSKRIPVRTFLGDETQKARGLNGPRAIADDIDALIKMLDPESEFFVDDGTGNYLRVPGGVSFDNLEKNLQLYLDNLRSLNEQQYDVSLDLNTEGEIDNCSCSFYDIQSAIINGKKVVVLMTDCSQDVSGVLFHACTVWEKDDEGVAEGISYYRFDGIVGDKVYSLYALNPNFHDKAFQLQQAPWFEDVLRLYVTEEMLSQMRKSLTEELQKKANKANTLEGYGITDAYTQSEVSDAFNAVDQEMKTKASVEDLDKKLEETVLYEDVVNTPLWQNQPSVSGDLSGLNPTDFYYVTLKDALGNPLAGGQFMLKNSFADDATVYSALFSLSALNTGTDTLTENYAVELTESYQFRDAGVSVVSKEIPYWSLSEGTGTIRTTLHGELIPKNINVYYYCDYKTDNEVASYHSTNGTAAFQSDSTEDIVVYVSMPELQYPKNRIFDSCTLRTDGKGCFSLDRNSVVKYQNNKAKLYQAVGYGNLHTQSTHITSIILRVNNPNNGLFRNGSVIRVTEVK